MKTIAVIGTFDSKQEEFAYVQEIIHQHSHQSYLIDVGVFEHTLPVDVTNKEVLSMVGIDYEELISKNDRGLATKYLSQGIAKLLPELYEKRKFDAVISLGGSGGTSIATAGMRELPIGVPKMMVSTLAGSKNVEAYVGNSDIIMMPSIVDVAGLNSISKRVFSDAVGALIGILSQTDKLDKDSKPKIAASMFGVTTPCVNYAREYLEKHGYEVLVFHATGTGGNMMEKLIAQGYFAGVLDLTTTELVDYELGGILASNKDRMMSYSHQEIPTIISVGALDMANFGPLDTVPKKYQKRNLYEHNPSITLMRTNEQDNQKIAELIAKKLNTSNRKQAMYLALPKKGISALDAEGQAFYGPKENKVLFETLTDLIDSDKVVIETYDHHINDREFAEALAQKMIDMIEGGKDYE